MQNSIGLDGYVKKTNKVVPLPYLLELSIS